MIAQTIAANVSGREKYTDFSYPVDFELSDLKDCTRTAIGMAYGTFGEFLQGVLPSGRHFLVTSPIELYSYASFKAYPGLSDCTIFPKHKIKSLQLAKRILSYFDKPESGEIVIESDIPEGKGLASSSSDLVATARALNNYYNLFLPTELLESFIAEIEPSDGVMHHGIVAYYHRDVKLKRNLGTLPPLVIAGIDEGGHVDTIMYNKADKNYTEAEKNQYQVLLNEMTLAIHQNDLFALGKIATKSALMNQRFNSKKSLPLLLKINDEVQGLGLIAAHSGSFLGILLRKDDINLTQKLYEIQRAVNAHQFVLTVINTKKF